MKLFKYMIFLIPILIGSIVFAQPIPIKWYYYTNPEGVKIPIYGIQLIYSATVPIPKVDSMVVDIELPNSIINRLDSLCRQYDTYAYTNYGKCYLIYPNYKIVRKIYDPGTDTYSYPEVWRSSYQLIQVVEWSGSIPKKYRIIVDTSNMVENETFYIVLYFYNPIIIPAGAFASTIISCPDEPMCIYRQTGILDVGYPLNEYDLWVGKQGYDYVIFRKPIFLNLSRVTDWSFFVYAIPKSIPHLFNGAGVGILFELYSPSDGSVVLVGLECHNGVGNQISAYPSGAKFYRIKGFNKDCAGVMDIQQLFRSINLDISNYSILRYVYIGLHAGPHGSYGYVYINGLVLKLPQ